MTNKLKSKNLLKNPYAVAGYISRASKTKSSITRYMKMSATTLANRLETGYYTLEDIIMLKYYLELSDEELLDLLRPSKEAEEEIIDRVKEYDAIDKKVTEKKRELGRRMREVGLNGRTNNGSK